MMIIISEIPDDEPGGVLRLSTANFCGPETLGEFKKSTAEHRLKYGDDADDFVWLPDNPALPGVSGEDF